MKTITIDPEFKALIPPLSAEELRQLQCSISAYGVRDALVVWEGKDILVDGHNRWEYCRGKDILPPPRFEYIEFDDRAEVKDWIIRNQLGRRNLDPDNASRLRGMLYNGQKKENGQRGKEKLDQSDTAKSTADKLAKETGVSAPTIKRDAKFVRSLEKLGMTVADMKAQKLTRKNVIEKAFPPKKRKPKASPQSPQPAADAVQAVASVPTPEPVMESMADMEDVTLPAPQWEQVVDSFFALSKEDQSLAFQTITEGYKS